MKAGRDSVARVDRHSDDDGVMRRDLLTRSAHADVPVACIQVCVNTLERGAWATNLAGRLRWFQSYRRPLGCLLCSGCCRSMAGSWRQLCNASLTFGRTWPPNVKVAASMRDAKRRNRVLIDKLGLPKT